MNTALSMGGNNVNDGAALTASGTVTVGGGERRQLWNSDCPRQRECPRRCEGAIGQRNCQSHRCRCSYYGGDCDRRMVSHAGRHGFVQREMGRCLIHERLRLGPSVRGQEPLYRREDPRWNGQPGSSVMLSFAKAAENPAVVAETNKRQSLVITYFITSNIEKICLCHFCAPINGHGSGRKIN